MGVYLPMHSLVLLQVTKHVTCMSRDAEIIGVNGIETVDASIDDIARWRSGSQGRERPKVGMIYSGFSH